MEINNDVALIFEGGGMRAAYTSAVVRVLLENNINCGFVAGISAGSSNLVNYVSRDPDRARVSFVDFAADPQLGSMKTMLRGQGYFNSHYIYQQTSAPGQALPLDTETFFSNPAQIAIGGFNATTGESVYWTREDISDLTDLVTRVQASSTLPGFMPLVDIDGDKWADGALGPSGGIALDAARATGYSRFLVILSRPRDYWKAEVSRPRLIQTRFRKYPHLVQAILERPAKYNAVKQELLDLEEKGDAVLFVPETMTISVWERNVAKLQAAYDQGLAQAESEVSSWLKFTGLAP